MLLLDLKDLKLKVPFTNTSPAKCLLTIKHFPRPPSSSPSPNDMEQPSPDRRIQSLSPVALASLGTARLVLDTLKSNGSFVLQMYGRPRGQKSRPAVVVSPDDRIDESCSYTEESCPYLVKQATCQRNGRPNSYYKNWRWQPNDCNLPRFDALKLMQILGGKRLMFVGALYKSGQFESLRRIPPRKIFKVEVPVLAPRVRLSPYPFQVLQLLIELVLPLLGSVYRGVYFGPRDETYCAKTSGEAGLHS